MRVVRIVGSGLGLLGYIFASKRRKIGLKNLSLCFPEMSETEKKRIIKAHFKHLLTSALAYGIVFYASLTRLKRIVKLKNEHYLTEFYSKRPVILLCPHFVGLDLAASRLTTDYIGCSIYSRQKNSIITEKLKQARLRFGKASGSRIFARQDGLRPIIRHLRQGQHLFFYLPDQDFGEKDSVFVPFFAYPHCATVNVLPKLVDMVDAVVVPMAVYSTKDGYEVEFFPAFENYPSGNLEQDVIRMNQFIESVVEQHIEEYFWLHKRFKTQPGVKERGLIYK